MNFLLENCLNSELLENSLYYKLDTDRKTAYTERTAEKVQIYKLIQVFARKLSYSIYRTAPWKVSIRQRALI